jgi:hypothetical protein
MKRFRRIVREGFPRRSPGLNVFIGLAAAVIALLCVFFSQLPKSIVDKGTPNGRSSASADVVRTPHLDFDGPRPLRPASEFYVKVYADTAPQRDGEEADSIGIRAPVEVNTFPISTWLCTSEHFIVRGSRQAVMSIDRNSKVSTVVSFSLQVRPAEEITGLSNAFVAAYFDYHGIACGKVLRKAEIAPPAAGSGKSERGPDSEKEHSVAASHYSGPAEAANLALNYATNEPDLTVEVCNPRNRFMEFDFRIRTPLLPEYASGKLCTNFQLDSPQDIFLQQFVADLYQSKGDPGKGHDTVASLGRRLFREATPPLFKEVFFKLAKTRPNDFKTIYVASEEPFIPWELMVPTVEADQEDPPPLGVTYSMGRWVDTAWSSPASSIQLLNAYIIKPEYTGNSKVHRIRRADEEADYVKTNFNGVQIPALYDTLKTSFQSNKGGLLHFVAHGESGNTPGEQVLYLNDTETLESPLVRNIFRKFCVRNRPLIFLNCCELGSQVPSFTTAEGFAPAFATIRAGGIIAPLWQVDEEGSFNFAREFYEMTRTNKSRTFASIIQEMRARVFSNDTIAYNPSYAAYVFYGDPFASQMKRPVMAYAVEDARRRF